MSDTIRMKHLREAGFCNREPRQWFKQHGFSWQDFLDHGIPVAVVRATGDPLAIQVAEIAEADVGR
jgi:hypothetical protein